MDICNTLCCLGVLLRGECFICVDNESVINSAYIPHAKLHKRYITLLFHIVRESIAAGVILFEFLGKDNLADIISKYWDYQQVWKILQPILFWRTDNMNLILTHDNGGTKNGNGPNSPVFNINGECHNIHMYTLKD